MIRQFPKYGSLLLLVAAGLLYGKLIRPWHRRWGVTESENRAQLPGDDRVPQAQDQTTRGITIRVPAEAIWPWLVQIGQDKGGFYSYAWLENLVGCCLHNADHVIPEFQHIQAGDSVQLHPKAPPLPVLMIEPGKAMVLGSNTDEPGTWGFYLRPLDHGATRLLIRGRSAGKPGLLPWIGKHLFFEPAHFIMERKMLLNLKARAENSWRPANLVHG